MKKYHLLFLAGLLIASFVVVIVAIITKSANVPTSDSAANSSSNSIITDITLDKLQTDPINSDVGPVALNFTKLEIANTAAQREQGLQNRTNLCSECGMLFVFEQPGQLSFWMKNTSIPLDLVFIDSDGVIVKIHENTVPFQLSPTYDSNADSLYTLEVNAGYARSQSLKVGTKFDIESMIKQGSGFD